MGRRQSRGGGRREKVHAKTIAQVEVGEYDNWAIQEYGDSFSFVGGWIGRDGDFMTSFVTEEFADGKEYTVTKGPGGKFDSLEEISKHLSKLAAKVRNKLDRQDDDDEAPF